MSRNSICEAAREQIDRLIGGETVPEAGHIAECEACRTELETRRNIRARLRTAVRRTQPDSVYLEQRVRTTIRMESEGRFRWHPRFLAAAAAVIVTAGVIAAYQLGHLRVTAEQQNVYIATISSNVVSIMRAGLQDHVHCSVFRNWPKETPALSELVEEMQPKYRPVAKAVEETMPKDYQIIKAHECGYRGRRYIHVAMRNGDGGLVSLVLARKLDGETFTTSSLRPVLTRPDFTLYGSSVQRFQIAGFETAEFLAFVVSDMNEDANRQLAVALARPVADALTKAL